MSIVFKEKKTKLYNALFSENYTLNDYKLVEKYNALVEYSNDLLKKINKLEWIIAILVSVLFSIGYLFLLKLCIWWLL